MGEPLKTLTIRGFKSIKNLEAFELRPLNVLIGANGAGKSNFVSFFRLLRAMIKKRLQKEVADRGGAGAHLFRGAKRKEFLSAKLEFGPNAYEFTLERTEEDGFVFSQEAAWFGDEVRSLWSGHAESRLKDFTNEPGIASSHGVPWYVHDAVSSWTVYHFHDTGEFAPVRGFVPVRDNERLAHHAGNLAAFLLMLRDRDPARYRMIRDTVRLAAPFFDDFHLRIHKRHSDEETLLEWKQKGSDTPFQPAQLSDGTIRFACLATALLQPQPPSTILVDEPELGLHPYALDLLAGLLRQASERTQVIVSTQSAPLLDNLEPGDIVVVDREEGATTLKRLDPEALATWLESYSLGDLWRRNFLSGAPVHE